MGESVCQSLKVLAEKPILIKPARQTEKSTIFLHIMDQHVFFHVEMLLIYDVGSPDSTGVVDQIRNALSEALVPYYFVAGRLKVNEEEARLELDCNEQGAVFAGAYCDSAIAELGDFRVPNPEFRKLFIYPANVKEISDLPLLTIQVTRFKCGGFIVGIYASHVVYDGISGCQFYNDLAKISRGESLTSAYPAPDRTCLQARSPPRISYCHRELLQLPDMPAKLFFDPSIYNPKAPPRHAFKIFSFTSEDLNTLKKKALKDGSIVRCSTFEVLAAHIWQARTKAAGMDPDSISKLFVIGNIRDKLKLSANFCGNAVLAAPCVDTTVSAVCGNPLSFCVRKVQQAVALVNEEYIRSVIDWCEVNRHGVVNLPGSTIITSWSKLAFNDVDFGWGRPTYITPVVNERPGYVVVLPNCRGDGGVDVFMGIEFERAAKLEECLKF